MALNAAGGSKSVMNFFGKLRKEIVLGIAIAATGLLFAAVLYQIEREALIERSEGESRQLLQLIAENALSIFEPAREVHSSLDDAGIADMDNEKSLAAFYAATIGRVKNSPNVSAVHVGFADGRFWQTRGEMPEFLEKHPQKPKKADQTVRRRLEPVDGGMRTTWSVFDADERLWIDIVEPGANYDPRGRPWYRVAATRGGTHWSEPYRSATDGQLKLTMSERLFKRDRWVWGILAVDFYLDKLTTLLHDWQATRLTPGAWIGVVDRDGKIVTKASGDMPIAFENLITGLFKDERDMLSRFEFEDREYFGAALPLGSSFNLSLSIVIVQPADAVFGPAVAKLQRSLLWLLAVLAILVAVAVYAIKMREEIKARKVAEAGLMEAKAVAEAARVEAEEATKAKSSFLAMMSHEIRTPMNGVMSMAEMLDQTELTDDQRSMSGTIRGSASALLTIINDILDFSKIEAGKLDIEKVPFSLVDTIEGVGELLIPKSEDKAIDLVVDLDPTIPDALVGDPTRLRQVILNLAGNAVKFTDKGSVEVVVRALQDGANGAKNIRFEIKDTGIGLSPEQQARLFQPFQQADTSTSRKFGGTGLGLSISLRLVELMGGKIGVESELGKGSTFWFQVPLGVASPEIDRPAIDIADATVVCVDATARGRGIAEALLAAAGISKTTFVDSESLDIAGLGALAPQGILLVMALREGETALALARRLRETPATKNWKAILVTSRSLVSTMAEADRAGFVASLTSPLKRRRFWRVMAAAMGRASLEDRSSSADADIGWAPPPLDEALAAGVAILVAEDNPTNQVVITRLLNQRGYAHEIADNGKAALGQLDGRNFGLLLSDFHMPEMDGFELTAEVRKREADGGRPRMPIVALTADALPGTEERCLEAGMDGYLTKPIDSKLLNATLRKFLPGAADLRRRPEPKAAAAPPKKAEPKIDPSIFEMGRIADMFGGWNDDARNFFVSFVDGAPAMLGRIDAALAATDAPLAREAAHALKGAARSIGAVRLGQLASDLQDVLDAGDLDTASFLQTMLVPTYDELVKETSAIR